MPHPPAWSAFPGALIVAALALSACEEPAPEVLCASAARASLALDVNGCIADLKEEKANDPATFDRDAKCLAAVPNGRAGVLPCLESPASLPRVRADLERRVAGASADTAALDAQMDKLRGTLGRLTDPKHRAAFDKLLEKATQEGTAVKKQLGTPADAGPAP